MRTREESIRELAGLVNAGRSPQEIQERLGIGYATVDRYVRDAIARNLLPDGVRTETDRFALNGRRYGASGVEASEMDVYLVYGDVHCPFQDDRSIEVLCQIAEDLHPGHVIENGDGIDCYLFSRFSKNPERAKTFQAEREIHARVVKDIRSACPDSTTYTYLGGEEDNHFMRFIKNVVWVNSLGDMPELQPARILYLEDHEYEEGPVFIAGTFRIAHGVRYGVNAASLDLRDYMISGIQNHSHRLNTEYRTTPAAVYLYAQNGHLSDVNQAYKRNPDWQQGFSILYMLPSGHFRLEQVPIVGHQAIFRGKLYAA